MKKKKIKILHVAQAAGGVDRYIRMLLKYLDKEKFENILVCSQDFRENFFSTASASVFLASSAAFRIVYNENKRRTKFKEMEREKMNLSKMRAFLFCDFNTDRC